jgi:hypothetical protein
VSDISGKTTTRASAARTARACARAFAATSYPEHGGWATATMSGERGAISIKSMERFGPTVRAVRNLDPDVVDAMAD